MKLKGVMVMRQKEWLALMVFGVLLVACGGGGEDGKDSHANDVGQSGQSTLTVSSRVKNTIKDLSGMWSSKVTIVDGARLSFDGVPGLAKGDVFVVNNKAYKVESVAGGPASSTIVGVSEPALNEIFDKIELSGKMDAVEFIPNPDLLEGSDTVNSGQIATMSMASKLSSQSQPVYKIIASEKEGDFNIAEFSMTKKFNEYLQGKGSLRIGAKADFSVSNPWEIISNQGTGRVEVLVDPSFLLSVQKKISTSGDYDAGLCSTDGDKRKGGRVYLGAIPLGKAFATLPGGTILAQAIEVNVPLCLPVNVISNMQYDLLNLSGSLRAIINVGNRQPPTFSHNNSVVVAVPPESAKLADATFLGSAKKTYTVDVKAEVGLEVGLEVRALGIVNAGVNMAALAKPSLTGTFGVDLVSRNFSSLDVEPNACLELKLEAQLKSKAFMDTIGDGKPLSSTETVSLIAPKSLKYGQCKCSSANYEISIRSYRPDFTGEEVATVRAGDSLMAYNGMNHIIGLRREGVFVDIFNSYNGGAKFWQYKMPEVAFGSNDISISDYEFVVNDLTNGCQAEVPVNLTVSNELYRRVVGRTLGVNNSFVTSISFSDNGIYSYGFNGSIVQGTSPYSLSGTSRNDFVGCDNGVFVNKNLVGYVGPIYTFDSHFPSYIMVNEDGTYSENSFYMCPEFGPVQFVP